METSTFQKIYKLVSKIPEGKVSTYGIIAKAVGNANPRVVGYALHSNKTPDTVPCYRVVHVDGSLAKGYAFGGLTVQRQLLEQEGIAFSKDKVILSRHIFDFDKP